MPPHALITGLFLIALTFSVSLAHAQEKSWPIWLEEFKTEARQKGISEQTLNVALFNVQPNDQIVKLDRKQPEGRLSWTQYVNSIVAGTRITNGRANYVSHADLLAKVSARYKVQPQFIVALWGIETNYGAYTGNYSIIESLATLAYEGRRAELFRAELLAALQMIETKKAEANEMVGSWAGAMGQTQFMPSSYLKFAQDWDKNGHADIWKSEPDAFASIANYLHESGWNGELTWGYQVNLPAGFNPEWADLYKSRTVGEWTKMGVTRADGAPLPSADTPVYVMYPGSNTEAAYAVTQNYHVLLQWNRSRYFATSVGLLSDRISH